MLKYCINKKKKGYGPTFTRTPRNRSPGGHILFYLQFSTNKEKQDELALRQLTEITKTATLKPEGLMDAVKTGNLIRKLREEAGLSQKQLAEMVNVTNTAISKYEHGTRFPDLSVIESLSHALNTDVASLIAGETVSEDGFNQQNLQAEIEKIRIEEAHRRHSERLLILAFFAILILRIYPFYVYPGVASVTGTVSFLKYPLLFMIALLLWVSGVLTMHRSLLKGTVLMTGSVILIGLTDMLCWPFASIQLQMISWAMMSSYALYILLIFTAVKRLG
jgi:transcriptional regulator with XRE-family HTH domain